MRNDGPCMRNYQALCATNRKSGWQRAKGNLLSIYHEIDFLVTGGTMFPFSDHFCAGRDGHRHFGGGRGGFFGGSFGGGFRGGGPGMRTAKMLASGDLQLIILRLLSEKP